MTFLIIILNVLLLNSLSNANPVGGQEGLTDEDFKNAETLPEEYKRQPKGKWNIDNHGDGEDGQEAYNVPRDPYRKWPGARVPYVVDGRYTSTERAIIAQAITNIQAVSCVRFVPRTSEVDYIYITPDYENG
ncbi:NAS-15 protein-like protein [Leptotrombidium deliense]|uniref:NAS-15 protein-like protein n=1 Tax=Leptotrombidium deliense TaxID=299467 RepID=A0A443S116_9ACAR|nr:NAS-15 protein-like protein [Leptotrombidium deliense]